MPIGAVYEVCRELDLRLLWLRRVWQFFAEKFDQRDTDLAETLKAADEIVWSCYHQVFAQARLRAPEVISGTAPLPFIEPRYSPSTFPADLVPADLQSEVDKPFLTAHLNRLPVPVVRLQPACVSEPWWLIYAGHEVGHSVQFDLLPARGLVDGYRLLVQNAVRQSAGDSGDVTRWGNWSREIFADVFWVLTMGPWAIWAMVELELQRDQAMIERRERYPSGAIRLKLVAAVAAKLGLEAGPALRDLDLGQISARSAAGRRDADFVEPVVNASLGPLPGLSDTADRPPVTLAQLCNFRAADFHPGATGRVDRLRRSLATSQPPAVMPSVDGPRLGAAAALAAWADQSETAGQVDRGDLGTRSLTLITASGPPGTREAVPVADAAQAVDDLVKSLLNAPISELEG